MWVQMAVLHELLARDEVARGADLWPAHLATSLAGGGAA
jgi:hypothetical protein